MNVKFTKVTLGVNGNEEYILVFAIKVNKFKVTNTNAALFMITKPKGQDFKIDFTDDFFKQNLITNSKLLTYNEILDFSIALRESETIFYLTKELSIFKDRRSSGFFIKNKFNKFLISENKFRIIFSLIVNYIQNNLK